MSELNRLLEEIVAIDGIKGAIIISQDGFVLDYKLKVEVDTEIIGAVIANGIGSARSIGDELKFGNLSQSMFEYDQGLVFIKVLSADAILAVLGSDDANIGNVRFRVKRIAADIQRVL